MGDFPGLPTGWIFMNSSFHLLVCWRYSTAWFHTCIHFRAEIVECQRLTPREFGHFFPARWFCSSVGVQCNTVQSLCDFMCNIGRFGNSQDCVTACPRLNWFKNVKNNFCGPTNQSIGPNFPRGQHATIAGWREHDGNFDNCSANNFDTRTLKANHKAKRWIVLLNMGFSFTVYLRYLAISDETWKHPIWIYLKYNHHHNHHHNHQTRPLP